MFTFHIKADVHVHSHDPEVLAALRETNRRLANIERDVHKLADALPGPAARIVMTAGPETEQA